MVSLERVVSSIHVPVRGGGLPLCSSGLVCRKDLKDTTWRPCSVGMDWCLELPGMWLLKKWDALRSSYSPPSDGSKVSVYHRVGVSLCTQEGTSCPAPKGSLEGQGALSQKRL